MDIDKIRTLIELMEEKELVTLEFSSDNESVSLTRYYPTSTASVPIMTAPAGVVPVSPDAHTFNQSANTHNTGNQTANQIANQKVEKSPMVGVFYSSPSPNDPPFTKVGQKVQAGDTLGIIEAMKIMNPLEATQSGIIDAILVDNAQVVEFGQPIIRYQS